jgi:hypothetical protein
MRDMMAQIRDVGDGIRGGTYTMTAPVITGGSINGTTIGATTASTGAFSTLSATGVTTVQAGTVSAPAITTTGDTNTGIFFPAADTIAFTEGGAEAARFDSGGKLGIGTTSPDTRLQVNDSSEVAISISTGGTRRGAFYADGSLTVVNAYQGNPLIFSVSSSGTSYSEKMRIDSSGNVGIGTSSPTGFAGYKTIQTDATSGGLFEIKVNGTRTFNFQSDASTALIETKTAIPITFGTSGTERMRILSSGEFLVAKTGASLNTTGIEIATSGQAGITVNQDACLILNRQNNDGIIVDFYRGTGSLGSRVGSISVTTSATTYSTSSDYRLKENIAPMTGALTKVQALKPCTYTWKSTGEQGEGFIAHELAEVCPDAVSGEKDALDKEGNISPQGIDTSFLVATLTAAIQELKAEFDAYKATHP